ncbi:MAG: class I SAM-dependent methyltransferase [Planctomycetota bacterium]
MTRSSLRFLREFISRPQSVGAVAPSSLHLARTMLGGIDLDAAELVVELGPGTGALTREIVRRLGPSTMLIAIESNPRFVRLLKDRFPTITVFHGCAEETPRILLDHDLGRADCIVSGLPWASFTEETQKRLIHSVLEALREGGSFTTFAYSGASWLPKARRFRKLLRSRFSGVVMSPVVWRNVPPAFAYLCRK